MKMSSFIVPATVAAITVSGAVAQERPAEGRAALRLQGAVALVQARGAASVAAQLAQQGYRVTEQRRTLLGRTLLRAESRTHVREVVIHQRTGEILRDVILAEKPTDRGAAARETVGAGSGGLASFLGLGRNSARGQASGDDENGGARDNASDDRARGDGNAAGAASGGDGGNGNNDDRGNGGGNGGGKGNGNGGISADVSVGESVGVSVGIGN
ncbi:hypothetical protein [Brevirhabdus sp.]|uniref:hypothetical protein n=1 Tax=Brevirhabdus sp. TaxID=2004514 RepID=UPI00405A4484